MNIIFSGPTTIGKDSIWVKAVELRGFTKIVPYTTRQKRDNETHGNDYYFVSKEEFKILIRNNVLLDWDYFSDNYYGTLISQFDFENVNYVWHSLSRMALRVKKRIPNTYIISLRPKSINILISRLQERDCSKENLLVREKHIHEELDHSELFDFELLDVEEYTLAQATNCFDKILNAINS